MNEVERYQSEWGKNEVERCKSEWGKKEEEWMKVFEWMKGIRVNEEERYKDDDENIWMDSWIKFSMRMFGENPISSRVWIQTWENCHSQKYFPTLNCKLGKLYFSVFSKVVNIEFSVSKLVNPEFSFLIL